MDLTVPTTFTASFLEGLAAMREAPAVPEHRVVELYGSFPSSVAGSGRPSKYLPELDAPGLARHVAAARRLGIRFRYLLNAPCLGNSEYTPEGRAAIRELLATVRDAGVEAVTVAIPLLVEWIREDFPEFDIKASTLAYATTVRQVQALARLGCRSVCLDIDANRDFELLRTMVAHGGAKVELIANPACLLSCAYRFYHNQCAGHGSQDSVATEAQLARSEGEAPQPDEGHSGGTPYGPYCLLRCHLDKLRDPVELLKTPWIRPEDLRIYQELGIASAKLAGRGLAEEKLLSLIGAYVAGRHEGNLAELIGWSYWNLYAMHPVHGELPPLEVDLDNRSLDGFLTFFATHPYRCHLGCAGCGHCPSWARKALRYDRELADRYRETMEGAMARERSGTVSPRRYRKLVDLWSRSGKRRGTERRE